MSVTDDLLRKVRALLAKAERTDNEHEAEAFTAKANALMVEHQITSSMLGDSTSRTERTIGKRVVWFYSDETYAEPKARMLMRIAKGWGVASYFNARSTDWDNSWKTGTKVTMFGTEDALDAVQVLMASLMIQATRAAAKVRGYNAADTRGARASFFLGFGTEVGRRIDEQRKQIIEDSKAEGALVLLDDLARADRAMRDSGIKIRTVTAAFNGRGYEAGRQSGRTADIGSARLSTSSGPRALGRG